MKAPRVVIQEILRCQCIHSVSRVTAHELYNHQPEQKLGPQITKQTSTVTTACSMHWWLHDAGLVWKSEHCPSLPWKVHHCVKSPRPATPGQPSMWSLASSSQTCRWKQCNTAQHWPLARIVPYNFLHPVDPLTAKRRLPLTSPEKLQCPKLNLIKVPEMYAKIIRSIYLFYCFLILYISIFRPNDIQRYIFLHSFLRFFSRRLVCSPAEATAWTLYSQTCLRFEMWQKLQKPVQTLYSHRTHVSYNI